MQVHRVRGTQDVYGVQAARLAALEALAREVFTRWNFTEIRTPVLEHTELFARGIGEFTDIVHKEMYTFPDRKGRSLTLRPENTAGVVRAFLEEGLAEKGLARLFYMGDMFRYERPQAGRYRQFGQIGVEVLGDPTAAVEAEVLSMLLHFLARAGLGDLVVEINSVGDGACRPAYVETLRAFLQGSADRLCKDCNVRAEKNPMRVLDCKVESCQAVLADAPRIGDHLCAGCRAHHDDLKRHLAALRVPWRENPRLVRGFDYYTHTAFEVRSAALGSQDALLGGGRYDGLVEELGGKPTPGFGFALGVERVLMAAGDAFPLTANAPVLLAWMGDAAHAPAMKLADALRRAGVAVHMESEAKSFKNQLKVANRLNARWALILGDQEAADNTVAVKNLATGEQSSHPSDAAVLAGLLRDP